MIITVNQTRANGKNQFEIDMNGSLKYYAETPWFSAGLPFQMDNLRKLKFKNLNGEILYTTDYNVKENLIEDINPAKFLSKDGQKSSIMSILDKDNKKCGSIYGKIEGFWGSKECLEINNEVLFGYRVAKGKISTISIYKNDIEIAQITKPLDVINNLDRYYVHLIDEYSYTAELLSFFVIYIDYLSYRNGNEIVFEKYEINREYSYNKNNKFYNPDFIKDNFGEEEDIRFKTLIKMKSEEIKKEVKSRAKDILLLMGGAWIVMIVIFLVVYFNMR